MRRLLLPFLLLLTSWIAQAQTLLQQQSFEGTGTDAAAVNGYTASTVATGNSNIYFYNATLPVPGYLNSPGQVSTVTNINGIATGSTGTHFWASENVRRVIDANGDFVVRGNPPANVTLNSLNVQGKSNLFVTVALADAAGEPNNTLARWETDDFVRIQYRFNGTGNWTTIGQFVGDGSIGGGPPPSGRLRQDRAPLDGVADAGAPVLNQALTDYTFAIPGSGNTLEVRVEIDQDGASEEFGFDNIRVYGSAAASSPPQLANIEGSTLAYAEGSPATQITNTLTISDQDNTTLSGASVTISSVYNASEDRLIFVNRNDITGSFDSSTGVLTLTGTTTLANYQTALRSVQYQNTDVADASAQTRTVTFAVTDASGVTSSGVFRTIAVSVALDPASPPNYVETFETDGEGTRYTSNHFFNLDGIQFQRATSNPANGPTGGQTTFSNIVGSGYWFGENTISSANPSAVNNGVLTTKQINATGFVNLHFQIRLGAPVPNGLNNGTGPSWLNAYSFQLFYREAGNNTWTAFGLFRGTGAVYSDYGSLRQDTNPNGTGTPTGTLLTTALQNFDFALPAALNGKTVEFQMILLSSDLNNDFAFDHIQVTGTQVVAPMVTTADATNISTVGATLGGNVTSDGGATLTGRGVVYSSTNANPTIGAASTTTFPAADGTSTGTFSVNATNLTPGTRYYFAAYASNNIGTSYGSVKAFVTTPNAPVVTAPANGTTLATTTPTYTGTAQSGATITVYVDGSSAGTTTANGGNWSFTQPSALAQGPHTVYAQATITVNGTTSSASASSSTITFTVDTVAPTVTNFASTAGASGSNTAISPFPFTVTFSESVTGLSASGIQVTNGSVTSGPTGSGSGPYTFEVTPTTPNTATTVRIAANAAQDAAGNGNATSSTYTLTYQPPVTAAPVVVSPANNAMVNTRTPTYSGSAPTSSTVTVYVNGSSIGTTIAANGQFSLTQLTSLPDGVYSVSASAQSNGQRVSANSNVNTFTIDATAPVISNVGVPANGLYGGGSQVLDFTINFSEAVTVTGSPLLGLTIGSTNRVASYYSAVSGPQSLVFRYATRPNDLDTDGIVLASALTITNGNIRDAAGNPATLTLNNVPSTTGILVDAVAPTVVSSNRQNPTGSATNAGTVSYRVTFSESVSNVTPSSFTLTRVDGAVTGSIASVAAVSGSTTAFDVTVTGVSGNGSLRLDVKGTDLYPSSVTDLAGNYIDASFVGGQTYTIDQMAPSVVITSSAGASGGETQDRPLPFTLTFSESVTGLSVANLSVSNGTIGDFTMNSSSSYSFTVVPAANGLVSVSLAAGVTRDAAGNANTATSPYTITYRPPVTIGTVAVFPGSVCTGSSFTVATTIGRDAGMYSYTLTVGSQVFTGSTANAFSQMVQSQGAGNQAVVLRVSNGVDEASRSSSLTVNPLPTVTLASSGMLTCAQPSVTLTATGNGMGQSLTYRFSAPASQPAGPSSNTATVTTAGDYSVTAITTSGCSATATVNVGSNFSLATPSLLTQTGQPYPGGRSAVAVSLNTGNVNLVAGGCTGTINWTGPNNSSGIGTTIVVSTTAPGTFIYQARCQVGSCTSDPASATVTVSGGLQILHRDVDNYVDNNAIQPLLQLQNQGAGPLPYSALTLRYYLTVEGNAALSNLNVNYAQLGNGNVRLRYVPLVPAQTGAGGYVEVSFAAGAGSLAAGANSGNIQLYFAKADYSALNERDDFSYATVRDQLVSNLRITAYYNGALIAGIEPGGTGTPTPPPSISSLRALTESKNGPSATQISTFLEIRNEGTTPVNYSDLKARYYFTADGNERLLIEVDEGAVSARLVRLPVAVNGADTFLELSFTQGGQLAAGSSTGRIRYRISKPDGGRFDQSNDWSYQEQPADRSQNTRLPVLVGGQLVWGSLPSGASMRQGAAEPGTELWVRVLGNPIQNDQVEFEVTGAAGQPVQFQLLTPQGLVVNQQQVPRAEPTERHQLSVEGQAGGLFLLQVSSPTQSRTVKVIKAR